MKLDFQEDLVVVLFGSLMDTLALLDKEMQEELEDL
jgi:hypothetical protein